MARNLTRCGAALGIGVGGVLDYFSGRVQRAPEWVRRAKFEWLYRLYKQPWRWRRQLSLYRFALTILLSAAIGRKAVLAATSEVPGAQADQEHQSCHGQSESGEAD